MPERPAPSARRPTPGGVHDRGGPRGLGSTPGICLALSFVIGFPVIYVLWAAHGSAYRRVVEADVDIAALRPLTMCWLLVIAFLPFPTAVVGREVTTVPASFCIGTMFVLAVPRVVRLRLAGRRSAPHPLAKAAVDA